MLCKAWPLCMPPPNNPFIPNPAALVKAPAHGSTLATSGLSMVTVVMPAAGVPVSLPVAVAGRSVGVLGFAFPSRGGSSSVIPCRGIISGRSLTRQSSHAKSTSPSRNREESLAICARSVAESTSASSAPSSPSLSRASPESPRTPEPNTTEANNSSPTATAS